MTPIEAMELLNLVSDARETARRAVRYPYDGAARADDKALRELIGWVHEHIEKVDPRQPPAGQLPVLGGTETVTNVAASETVTNVTASPVPPGPGDADAEG
jgi:hypothetical protein